MKYLLACMLFLATLNAAAQDRWSLYSLGLGTGVQLNNRSVFPADSWEQFPGVTNPQNTDTGYTVSQFVRFDVKQPVYSGEATWKLPSAKGRTWLAGVLVSAGRMGTPSIEFNKYTVTNYDSLIIVDPQSFDTVIYIPGYVDTSLVSRYEYRTSRLMVSPRLVYRSGDLKRWSWFAGVQADFGIALKAEVAAINEVYVGGSGSELSKTYGPSNELVSRSTSVERAKKPLYAGITVPVGISFRLGKAESWWNRLSLSAEASASVYAIHVPEMNQRFAGNTLQAGIRVSYLF